MSVPFPRGVFAPIVTPFAGDSVDLRAAAEHTRHVAEHGPHGILVGGSGGEYIAMTLEERLALTEAVLAELGDRLPAIVCVASYATADLVRLARHAEKQGATALLVTAPHMMRPTHAAVRAHFETLREATELPVMLYNTPAATGIEFSLHRLVELVDAGILQGVKMSFPEAYRLRDAKATLGDSAAVYCGHDGSALESLIVGADGWISCIPVVFPGRALRLWNGVQDGEPLAALTAEWFELLPFVRMLYEPDAKVDGEPHWLEVLKAALDLLGQPVGSPRPPLRRLPPPHVARLEEILVALGELTPSGATTGG